MKKKAALRTHSTHHAPHFYVLFALVMIVVGAFTAIVVTKVIGQTANNVIYACSQKQTGNLRMVAAGSVCRPDEVGVSWNVQGPAGPAGSSGASNGLPYSCNNCNLAPFANLFKGKDFSGAQLYGSEFSGSDLTGVIFRGGYLNSDGFNNTNLTSADFSNIRNVAGDILAPVKFVEFENANLTNANFSNSQFARSNFSGANLTNANFSQATLQDDTFNGATWSNTTCPDGTNSNNDGNTCVGHF
jgi:hypothetical protein